MRLLSAAVIMLCALAISKMTFISYSQAKHEISQTGMMIVKNDTIEYESFGYDSLSTRESKLLDVLMGEYFVMVYDKWSLSINNPDNAVFVIETAFNLGIEPSEVTQEQFNKRYK